MRPWDARLSSSPLVCWPVRPWPRRPAAPADARKLYNQALYELAIKAATEARQAGDAVDEASLIFARAHLERFRQTRDAHNLTRGAGGAERASTPRGCPREAQAEFTLALGQWLFLADKFRAAAELFDSPRPGSTAWDRRRAIACSTGGRRRSIGRRRKIRRTARRSTSASSIGWRTSFACNPGRPRPATGLPAAARSIGDTDRAWHAALAGYLRARVAPDRGVALRADLDRLVATAVIPERARQITEPDRRRQARDRRDDDRVGTDEDALELTRRLRQSTG